MEYNVQPTPRFEKDLRRLIKKYPKTDTDIEPLFLKLENGNLVGDDITGLQLHGNKVFKVRVPNSSANRGLSGGFRVIYYVVTRDREIYLLTMYTKSEKEDIPNKEIIEILNRYI